MVNGPGRDSDEASMEDILSDNFTTCRINYPMTLGAFYSGFMPQLAILVFLCLFVSLFIFSLPSISIDIG